MTLAHGPEIPAGDTPSRRAMIELQLRRHGIVDSRLLAAVCAVPRELFVPMSIMDIACEDLPLPISHGQTIAPASLVALMIDALMLVPGDRVLEIGTGSGYSTAVLSLLADHVDTIERLPDLADAARERLDALGYTNIDVRCGDGTLGWPGRPSYSAIVVTASGPTVPPALVDQLAIGGRLVIPIGVDGHQDLLQITRLDAERCAINDLGPAQFSPLIGAQAWLETVW